MADFEPRPAVPLRPVPDAFALAERRARRAELAERAQAGRADAAEALAAELSVRLARLEAQAARGEEPDPGRIGELERELHRAWQQAFAEQKRREELEEEAREQVAALQAEAARLRADLAAAREHGEDLRLRVRALERAEERARWREQAIPEALPTEGEPPASSDPPPGEAPRRPVPAFEADLRREAELARATLPPRRPTPTPSAEASGEDEPVAVAEAPEGTPAPVAAEAFDLARSRLRAAVPPPAEEEEAAASEVAPEPEPEPEAPRLSLVPEAAEALEAEASEEATPAPGPAAAADPPAPSVAVPAGLARGAWVGEALTRVAEQDAALAGRLLLALVPAHHLAAEGPLAYRLEVEGEEPVEALVAGGSTRVGDLETRPELTLATDAAGLAELLARRGFRARRRQRRALRGRREARRGLVALGRLPARLSDLHEAGVRLDARQAYALLGAALPASALPEDDLVFRHDGYLFAAGPRGLRALPGRTSGPVPHAEVTTPPGGALAFLAGEDAGAEVEGDPVVPARLRAWAAALDGRPGEPGGRPSRRT